MIRIEHSREGDRHRLTAKGHAGYGPRGADIVCAGVSALTYALLASIEKLGGTILEAWVTSGDTKIVCRGGDGAFAVALCGMKEIARKYPQHVEVIDAAQGG